MAGGFHAWVVPRLAFRHRLTPTMTTPRASVDDWLREVELAFGDTRALRRIRHEARQAEELNETEVQLVVGRATQYLNPCLRAPAPSDLSGDAGVDRRDVVREASPAEVAAACGSVSDRWIDQGRAAQLEQMDQALSEQFWDEVASYLERTRS